jgi:adhesin transport system outer membrane protein
MKSWILAPVVTLFVVFSVICISTSVVHASTLPQLVHQALENHPKVAAQRAIVDVKKIGVETAEWQYFPTLSASYEVVSASASDTSYNGNNGVTTVRIQQPLWAGGRLDAGVDIANSQVAVETSQLDAVKISIAESVVEAYGKWMSGYRTMQAWEHGLDIHEQLQRQVENRVTHGVSAPIDLTLAQGRVASTRAEYLAAESEAQLALDEINQLTRNQYSHMILADYVSSSVPINITLNRDDIWVKSQRVDPQIKLAQKEIEAAQFELAKQQAATKPNVYLRAEQQVNNFSSAQTGSSMRFFIGISSDSGAGLSLLSKNSGAAAIVAAKEAALISVKYSKRQKLDNLVTKTESLNDRISIVKAAMETTSAVSSSYSRQFLAGRKTWQEVLNSAREQVQMEVQLVDLEAAALVAKWRLVLRTLGLTFASGA